MEKEICAWFVFNSGQVLIEKKRRLLSHPTGTEPPVYVPVGSTIHTIGRLGTLTAKTYAIHVPVSGDEESPPYDERPPGVIRCASAGGI